MCALASIVTAMRAEAGELGLALTACRHYYLENRSKSEIANRLGVSRFKVARLIAIARELGLVRIEIDSPADEDAELAQRLAARLGLERCIVTDGSLGEVAAHLLRRRLRPADALGIGWGRAVHDVVMALVRHPPAPPVAVVQLSGSLRGVDFDLDGAALAARAARALGGDLLPLHAPAFMETKTAHDALLGEASIRRTLEAVGAVAAAVVGVGAWQPAEESAMARSQSLSGPLLELARERRAVADVFGQLLDGSGRVIQELSDRAVAPGSEVLRRIPLRLGVATGATKVGALLAVAASGLLNALVTDRATALQLLEEA
jgi:DNA-binding transcriptional regulator LsrR (DeoR family)